jgi:RNA polymerase sigma-70 factor (ECF subfamily)
MEPDDGFESFYRGAFGRLVEQLFLVTGDVAEAEDVVQEAFARAATRWRHLRGYEVPERWVRRVALNLALDGLRRTRRRLAALTRLGPAQHAPAVSVDNLALLTALRSLPRGHRGAVVLHHLVGMPVEEVARELRVPSGTVKSWLARGRRALARELAEEPHGDPPTGGTARGLAEGARTNG